MASGSARGSLAVVSSKAAGPGLLLFPLSWAWQRPFRSGTTSPRYDPAAGRHCAIALSPVDHCSWMRSALSAMDRLTKTRDFPKRSTWVSRPRWRCPLDAARSGWHRGFTGLGLRQRFDASVTNSCWPCAVPDDRLRSSVRFSFGATTTEAEIDEAINRIAHVISRTVRHRGVQGSHHDRYRSNWQLTIKPRRDETSLQLLFKMSIDALWRLEVRPVHLVQSDDLGHQHRDLDDRLLWR